MFAAVGIVPFDWASGTFVSREFSFEGHGAEFAWIFALVIAFVLSGAVGPFAALGLASIVRPAGAGLRLFRGYVLSAGISQVALFASLVVYIGGAAAGSVHERMMDGTPSTIPDWVAALFIAHAAVVSVGVAGVVSRGRPAGLTERGSTR
ncbi:MAG: hypothetical protein ACJ790_04230 [Myxococcaceae bacterium]